jgi:FtsZ-interacting cell division protein YlmF
MAGERPRALSSRRNARSRTATVRLVTTSEHDGADVVAVRLQSLDELSEVVRLLERDREVVADLGSFDPRHRQRVFDVLSGVAYGLDASMSRYQSTACRYRLSLTSS